MKTTKEKEAEERSKEGEEKETPPHPPACRQSPDYVSVDAKVAAKNTYDGVDAKTEFGRVYHESGASYTNMPRTDEMIQILWSMGVDRQTATEWMLYRQNIGWRMKDGTPINRYNWRRSIRMFKIRKAEIDSDREWVQERMANRKERRERRRLSNRREELQAAAERGIEAQKREAEKKRRAESSRPESWALCEERCALYRASKNENGECRFCRAGYLVPPQLRERPVPPQECARFSGRDGA